MPLVAASKKLIKFDTKTFLSTINGGRKIEAFPKKQTIFAQGDSSDAVFYIQEGKVKLTVVSQIGKEATIGILNKGDFFGEGCLTGQPLRLCSATAMTDCSVMKIDKKSMNEVLHREHAFSDMFVGYLLARNIRYEEDLVDQLFNSSEKRLARVLLLLAHFGKDGKQETVIPKMSQEKRPPTVTDDLKCHFSSWDRRLFASIESQRTASAQDPRKVLSKAMLFAPTGAQTKHGNARTESPNI
jgi:CRP/FNR family transcriptional regulator, cyclic AMP receptor protein